MTVIPEFSYYAQIIYNRKAKDGSDGKHWYTEE